MLSCLGLACIKGLVENGRTGCGYGERGRRYDSEGPRFGQLERVLLYVEIGVGSIPHGEGRRF